MRDCFMFLATARSEVQTANTDFNAQLMALIRIGIRQRLTLISVRGSERPILRFGNRNIS